MTRHDFRLHHDAYVWLMIAAILLTFILLDLFGGN